MAKMSIKQRVTLFYAAVLILITLLLSTFFIVSLNLQINKVSQTTLERTVKAAFDHVLAESDWLEIRSDFSYYVNDVSLILYGPEGSLIQGGAPEGFPPSLPLMSDELQSITTAADTWQVYDIYTEYPNGTGLWVRGIYSLQNSLASFIGVLRTMMIALPITLIFAILLGYLITRRAFSPITRIQKTAEEITRNHDLSRRIALEGGTKDELYNLSQVIDSMFDQIETAFTNEKQFTSDVSHELRTPISVIISQAEYGLSKSLTTSEYRACLETILAKGEKTSQLIGSLLEISRVANAKTILVKEPLNLAELCDVVIEELTESAEERGVHLTAKMNRNIIINGDQTQLLRLVINLVSNAITHGKENGFVMLELHCNQDHINLSVSDDGVGIAPEYLDKIFNRFYQVNPARSGHLSEHSGLGLSMVKMIAEAHGGVVRVHSTPNVGSTFIVSFPNTCHEDSNEPGESGNGKKGKHFRRFKKT